MDINFSSWIGKSESMTERLHPAPAHKLAVTLNRPETPTAGDALPPAWQWIYFTPTVALAETGSDGHAKRGGFLPPIELPRRMWAGGRMEFQRPLRLGEEIRKTSTVLSVTNKSGKSGALLFVTVRHTFSDDHGLILSEEQDLVYRALPAPDAPPPAPQPAPAGAQFSRLISPTPVLLFRYSALTFNSHRIHYDLPYCQAVEGYPGLVVHAPLTATLLLDLVRDRTNVPVRSANFRAVSPLFADTPFEVQGAVDGTAFHAWALTPAGALAMEMHGELGG